MNRREFISLGAGGAAAALAGCVTSAGGVTSFTFTLEKA